MLFLKSRVKYPEFFTILYNSLKELISSSPNLEWMLRTYGTCAKKYFFSFHKCQLKGQQREMVFLLNSSHLV
jgi:hypothetical protein